jgi:hypothetical protein
LNNVEAYFKAISERVIIVVGGKCSIRGCRLEASLQVSVT